MRGRNIGNVIIRTNTQNILISLKKYTQARKQGIRRHTNAYCPLCIELE